MPRAVILVPYRAGFADRDRIWSFVRALWARDHPELEIFIGDPGPGPFNRSRAINLAAAAAGSWDVAVIIDADVVIAAENIRTAVEVALASSLPVLAYHERVHLSAEGTSKILAGYRGNWRARGLEKKALFDACSGAMVVSRPLWDAVGGFDELFEGWGWEDVAFRVACETVAGVELVKLAGTIYHFFHRVSAENNGTEPTFVANRTRGERYVRARFVPELMAPLLKEASGVRLADVPVEPAPATTVPRRIVRTIPAKVAGQVEEWWARIGELHPDWELVTHRDPLDPDEWETGDLWPKCQNGAQRAGLIRLEDLYRHGGIYLDSDVELYRPLDSLLGLEAFAGYEDRKVIPDAVLGARAGHPAWAIMLEKARAEILAGHGAWDSGPGVTTSTLAGRPDVLVLPPGSFFPYHYREQDRRDEDHAFEQPWAFGAHHWAGSWLTDQQAAAHRR